jgi:hypothetical protein
VTVSIGISAAPTGSEQNATSLVKFAEEALDVAKFEGRDRVKAHEGGEGGSGRIPWEELARQAKLAVVNERQSRLQSRLAPSPEYAPWMRATPGWGTKKKGAE